MSSPAPLIPEQRHQELLRLLRSAGVLSIRNITDHLGVSHMTVRRDIAALQEAGQVVAVPGGVRLANGAGREPPRERASRSQLALPQKRAIAERAAAMVGDDMVIFLDAGTTCASVVPFLAGRQGLTVLTNDFFVVTALFDHPAIEAIHTGGVVDVASGSSSGRFAAATVAAINVDLLLLSTGTWDIAHGVTTPALEKVTLKQAAMQAATTSVLLADSTKFGTYERFRVAALDELDSIITDAGLAADQQARLRELGVEVNAVSYGDPAS